MKKFEYMAKDDLSVDLKHPRKLIQELNVLGNLGWELSHVIPVGDTADMYIFKKEL